MKRTTAIIVWCACCTLAAAQTYSLQQLKDSALHNNIAIRNSKIDIEASRQQRKEALTMFFPNVSGTGLWFNANKALAQTTMNPSEMLSPELGATLAQMLPAEALAAINSPFSISMMKNGAAAGITALQPVFAGGQIINGNRLAKVGEDVSRLQLQLAENEVEKTTEQYFWQMAALKEKLKTVNAVDTLLADIYKDVEVALKAGVAMRNDLLQVQLRRNDVESQRLKLKNGISITALLLAQHCGLSGASFDIDFDAAADLGTDMAADATAIQGLPEYQLLGRMVEAAHLQKKMTIGEYLPSLAVGGTYSHHNLMEGNRNIGMVFATVSVPLSDWWGGSHAIKRKKLEHQKAIDEQRDKAQLLKIRMQNAWNSVAEARQQLTIARRSIEQAEENLRLNRNYYRAGTSKMTDLLEAQLLYQNALDQRTEAIADYHIKQLEYRQASGQ